MSIEAKLDELIAAINRNSDITEKNTAICERIVAGQEQALAKMAEGAPATQSRRRSSKAAAETPAQEPEQAQQEEPAHPLLAAANGETVKNDKGEDVPTENFRAGAFTREQVKAEFIGWLGSTTDPEERKARAAFVVELGQHFGVKQLFSPTEGVQEEDQFKQALFYLRRKREGLKADFSADYDFDGDPLADQTVDTDGAEDDAIDALG